MTRAEWMRRLRLHLGNVVAVAAGKSAALLGLVVGTRLLTEVASPATVGEWKLLAGVATLVTGILLLPYCRFAMREYHDAERDGTVGAFDRFARRVARRRTVLLALVLILALATYLVLVGRGAAALGLAACVGLCLVGESFYTYEYSLLVTRNRQVQASLIDALKVAGLPLVAVLGVLALGDGAAAILLAQVVLLGGAFAVARRLGRAGLTGESAAASAEQRRGWSRAGWLYVAPMIPFGIFQWIVANSNRYVLGYHASTAEVGQFVMAYGIVFTPLATLGDATVMVVFPIWFRRAAAGDLSAERAVQRAMFAFQAALGVGAFCAVLLLREPLSRLLLAPSFRAGAPAVMGWVAAGACLFLLATALEMRAFASKSVSVMTVSYAIAAATNLLLTLLWVPRWGALGAARATAVTFAVYLGAMAFWAWRDARR